ncbi:MAG: ElyC/SanA/YdcF family protein, partial [Bryobacteraceae bacterium]
MDLNERERAAIMQPSQITRWLVRAMAVTGAFLLIITFTPLVSAWARHLSGPWNDPRGEIAIVLSGSMLVAGSGPEAVIGESSYLRAVYALRAWRLGAFQKMLISGGGAPAIESFLRAYGVPKEAILLEVQSASTY